MLVTIAGNVCTGKSTLAKYLSEVCGWVALLENAQLPFVDDFYSNMSKWGFHNQMTFMLHKIRQRQFVEKCALTCQDQPFEVAHGVFSTALRRESLISDREFHILQELLAIGLDCTPAPDLIVYLYGDEAVLYERMQLRGWSQERYATQSWVSTLNRQFDEWVAGVKNVPVLRIDTTEFKGVLDRRKQNVMREEIEVALREVRNSKLGTDRD